MLPPPRTQSAHEHKTVLEFVGSYWFSRQITHCLKKVNTYLIQNNIIIWFQQQRKGTPAPVDEAFRLWPASGEEDRGLRRWMKTASRNRSSVPQNPPARLLHIPSPPSVLQTHSIVQSNAMLPKYEHYHTVLNKQSVIFMFINEFCLI